MHATQNRAALGVWAMLVAVTILSWALTEETDAARLGATAVIVIAAVKINLVIAYFMELKWTMQPWRAVLTAWIAVVLAIILGCYWLSVR